MVYAYLSSTNNMPPPKEFDDEAIEEATKTLALMLLRINAGKTSAVKPNSILVKLTRELAAAVKVVHEYPDSDDDDDEDGNENDNNDNDISVKKGKHIIVT